MTSIIIIVKNDKRIEKLLSSLKTHVKTDICEIIVVDASQGFLDAVKKKFPKVRWIYYKNTLNQATTIPEQRNTGIKAAKGDIIVFIDSDCIPQAQWLEALIKPIKKEKEEIVAGKVTLSDTQSLHTIEFEKNNERKYLDEAPTMNIAITKKVFQRTGMFDTHFQCGEDVDFLWRAGEKGYKIRYAPNAIIHHDLGNKWKEMKRMYTYGKARVMLYNKHTQRRKYFWGAEVFKIIYPLSILFFPLLFIFPYYGLLFVIFLLQNNMNINAIIMKFFYGAGILQGLIN